MTLTGCDYKSMELDCLLLQIFWETLSECCFGAKADGVAAPMLPNDRKDKNLTRLEFLLTFVKTGQ